MVWITTLSIWLIPIMIGFILIWAVWRKVPVYESFVDGGKEGVKIAFSLIPFLVGMLVAITIFRTSGAMSFFIGFIEPLLARFGVPAEIIPLAAIRPISGTAALGVLSDIIGTHGPDSYIGRLASTLQGSTDTTFYVLTVYFGAVGIKRMGDALKVGLLADLVGFLTALIIVYWMFG